MILHLQKQLAHISPDAALLSGDLAVSIVFGANMHSNSYSQAATASMCFD